MTTPVVHGYPDYGRFVPRADKLFVNTGAVVINGPTNYTAGYVGDQEALMLRLSATVSNYRATVRWGMDAAFATEVSQFAVDMIAGDNFEHSLAVVGPFFRLTAVSDVYPATIATRVATAGRSDSHLTNLFYNQHLISALGVAVGAGLVSNQEAVRVWPGLAFWSVSASPATWSCYLVSVDIFGVQRMIDRLGSDVAERGRLVLLPAGHIRTVFTNTSGAAGAYDVSVVAQSAVGIGT